MHINAMFISNKKYKQPPLDSERNEHYHQSAKEDYVFLPMPPKCINGICLEQSELKF